VNRLPIRWRVTLTFATALLIVLIAVGLFIYLRLAVELDQALDRGLRARAAEVSAIVARSPAGLPRPETPSLEADESLAQVLRPDGTVVGSTSPSGILLLNASQLRRARSGPVSADREGDARLDEAIRLLAVPVSARSEPLIVVVGASLDEKRQALSSLLLLELVGGAAALLVASAAGYAVAGVALRPVEAMRRRAEEITDQPDRRLPVTIVDDEIGRLGITLNAMLERLETAQAAERRALVKERRFVADASHELRTPLTILKSEIEVALLEGQSAPQLEATLRSIGEGTDRLCRLAEDLLVLSQAEGGLPIRQEHLEITRMLDALAKRARLLTQAKGRRITVRSPAGLAVRADGPRLEQALLNLIDNALRHGEGDIELVASRTQGRVQIGVRDNGAGFPEEFRRRAFERFSRADAGRTGGGAGLGLAIVQAIAHAHGGSVDAENAEPGARVQITLPRS